MKLLVRLGLVALASLGGTRSVAAEELKIPFTESRLDNGMTVILHEDHAVPLVAVNVLYKVGSRHERPGRTGFAHLFEHLMFMGTQRVPTKMFDAWMEDAGGWNNAWTSEDYTDYFDVAPSTSLPLLLWMEADRLRDLGAFMTDAKLGAQRDVVRNERRQTHENRPYGKVELRIPELLYPKGHPYFHPVIGSHEDLEAAAVSDVKEFFATYYDPANASLVVAGDFDSKAVLPEIKKWFGRIPSRGVPKDPGAPGFSDTTTTLKSVQRETLEDSVELSKVVMAWQTPKHYAPGDAALEVFAQILGVGKPSRLYKALVYDQKLAQDVSASQASGTLGSRFTIDVTARPGVSLDKLEAAIDKEVERMRTDLVAKEELERSRNGILTGFVKHLEGIKERAQLLNLYKAEVGDAGFVQKDLERFTQVSADDVRNVGKTYLDPKARVIVRVVPRGETKK